MSTTTSGHVTRTFEAATPHLLRSLIGIHDANLKQITEAIPIRIISRSGKMLLTGEPADVKLASEVIEAMQNRLMNNLVVDESVIASIIDTALSSKFHHPGSSSLDEYIEEVVGIKSTDQADKVAPAVKALPIPAQLPETKPDDAPEPKSVAPAERSETEPEVEQEALKTETAVEEESIPESEQQESASEMVQDQVSPTRSALPVKSTPPQDQPHHKEVKQAERESSRGDASEPPEKAAQENVQTKIKTCSPMSVHPRSHGQARYLQAIERNDLVICSGPAGSGKTYLSVAMALHCLQNEIVRKIVLVRPAVEAGEKLGFLPGDMMAKVNPFLRPLLDALRDMVDYGQIRKYMDNDVIEIVPLAFMRGRTLNDTFMILDEAQNTTITQMKMFLTRMGTGSKVIVTGDETQNDLPAHVTSGLSDAMKRLKGIRGATSLKLDGRDIVRHRLVRDIVHAYDDQPRHAE